jgi:hypothetical protein
MNTETLVRINLFLVDSFRLICIVRDFVTRIYA